MAIGRQSIDLSPVSESLQRVVKGTAIIFIGNMLGMILAFVARILIARHFTQNEYGIFSLAFTILSISAVIGSMGLQRGAPRQIAYYLGKGKQENVSSTVAWSLVFGLITGIIMFIIIFLSSDFLSTKIFGMPDLSSSLKIFSIAIPFYVLVFILTSIFRGYKKVKEAIYFQNFLKNILFILLLVLVILIDASFKWCIIAYSTSISITCITFLIYFIKKRLISPFSIKGSKNSISIGTKLLFFSIPLLFVSILGQVMGWMDTLMLGYFKTSEIVGLYNAAIPLVMFIFYAQTSVSFIYLPVLSELYSKNKKEEMRKSYAILTKWLCSFTFPLFLIFIFFPEVILNFFFGSEYIVAAKALQILAAGFFVLNIFGPNDTALTTMGETKFLAWATFIAAGINITLNILFIPNFGIEGAAGATAIAMVILAIMRAAKLYSISQIHSLRKTLLKPIFLSTILICMIYPISKQFVVVTFWMLSLFFIFFVTLYGCLLLLTRSFEQEDVEMLVAIEKKLGITLAPIKNLMKRFMQ